MLMLRSTLFAGVIATVSGSTYQSRSQSRGRSPSVQRPVQRVAVNLQQRYGSVHANPQRAGGSNNHYTPPMPTGTNGYDKVNGTNGRWKTGQLNTGNYPSLYDNQTERMNPDGSRPKDVQNAIQNTNLFWVAQFNQELKNAEANAKELRNLKDEVERLRSNSTDLSTLQSEVRKFGKENTSLNQRLAAAETERKRLVARVKVLQSELETAARDRTQGQTKLQKAHDALEKTVASLTTQLSGATATKTKLLSRIAELDAQVIRLNEAAANHAGVCEECQRLRQKLASSYTLVNQLILDIIRQAKEIKSLETKNSNLKRDYDQLKMILAKYMDGGYGALFGVLGCVAMWVWHFYL